MKIEPDDISIRPALRSDIAAIQGVARLAWAAAYQGMPQAIQEQAIVTWYSDEVLATAIEGRQSLFLVAERAKAVVAFVHLYHVSSKVIQLARIYLLPNEQRKGLGTRLLNAALAMLPSGIETIAVEVEEQNHQARTFYEHRGFIPVSQTTANIFGFHLPLLKYEKTPPCSAA
jgi:GNAT superfamily N-acetyltransferase